MEGVPLLSGAYKARSVIASAQRCVNLYIENNPSNVKTPMPATHYPRPGKIKVWEPPVAGTGRGLYRASNGDLYAIVNNTVYFVNSVYNFNVIGNITAGSTPVAMADNGVSAGQQIALVDGTTTGYEIDMVTYTMAPIVDVTGMFTGADTVAYLETYFIFNTVPNTQNFIISQPNSLTFDALDIAAKAAYADNLINVSVRYKELILFGDTNSTEPWALSGALDFPFEAIPSTFISYGSFAKYGQVFSDTTLYWIAVNQQGRAIFLKLDGYTPKRVSNHAIETMVQKFPTITDAVAQSFQIEGHTFVIWSFPTADKTLVLDLSTGEWAEWAYIDEEGALHQDRGRYYASAYGKNFTQDWETGAIYELSTEVYDDDGAPVSYIRGFPVLEKELNRVTHNALRAYMECGTQDDPEADTPEVLLFISDDGGKSWYDPIPMSLGALGEYDNIAQATCLGQARNRVYELVWSASVKTALNGVYIDADEADS